MEKIMVDGVKIEVKKTAKKFTWGLFLTGTFLFLTGIWFAMSMSYYKASETIFPFRTAGWFILGFMFVSLFAGGISAVFCLIARKFRKTAWVLMLIVSVLFIYKAVIYALPYNRITEIVGEKAAGEIKLEEFYTGDSFNDGIYQYGIIAGNESTMDLIKKYRPLEHEKSVSLLRYMMFRYFKNHSFPLTGDIYSNADKNRYFYVSPGENKIYFFEHSIIQRAKPN